MSWSASRESAALDYAVFRVVRAVTGAPLKRIGDPEEIAGAVWTPDSLQRAWAQGLRPLDHLLDNNGHGFFEALGDGVVSGPTLTNVNDFRAILIDRA